MPSKVTTVLDCNSSAASSLDADEVTIETSMLLLSPKKHTFPSSRHTYDNDDKYNQEKENIVIGGIYSDEMKRYVKPASPQYCGDDQSVIERAKEINVLANLLSEKNNFEASNEVINRKQTNCDMRCPPLCEENARIECPSFEVARDMNIEHEHFKHYCRKIETIIRKNSHLVRLPTLKEGSNDTDKRISYLYQYMEEIGVQKLLNELELNSCHIPKSYDVRDDSVNAKSVNGVRSPSSLNLMGSSIISKADVQLSPHLDSSVEIARFHDGQNNQDTFCHAVFQSPFLHNTDRDIITSKKRQASTSGKKGADLHRKRLEDENPYNSIDENVHTKDCGATDSFLVHSFENSTGEQAVCIQSPQVEETDNSFLDSALLSPISRRESLLICQDDLSSLQTQGSVTHQMVSEQQHRSLNYDDDASNQFQTDGIHTSNIHQTESFRSEATTNDSRRDTISTHHLYQRDLSSEKKIRSQSLESNINTRNRNSNCLHVEMSCSNSFSASCAKENDSIDSTRSFDSDGHRKSIEHKDSITIEDDDDHILHRSITLNEISCVYYNPLKVYRPPKWARTYECHKSKNNNQSSGTHRAIRKNDEQKDILEFPKPLPTFTMLHNPFDEFGSRSSERLHLVLDWLQQRDGFTTYDTDKTLCGKAVVLSLTTRQIMCLALQLILKFDSKHEVSTSNVGGTLIVVKGRDDLWQWECELREKTRLTVLNHAILSPSERRSTTISSKASTFDVVLTTYDALKSKEVAASVDEYGRAREQTVNRGGWISSRQHPNNKEVKHQGNILSHLHLLMWQRIILVDELGRKSCVTKLGTSRTQAACALKGRSRLVFFVKSRDGNYFLEDNMKESRRQLVPLANMFDIPTNRTADDLVAKLMLDFRDVRDDGDGSNAEYSDWVSTDSKISQK